MMKPLKTLLRVITLEPLRKPAPKVAVIPLRGVIGTVGKLRSRGMVADELRETIERAFKLGGVKAVALAINSPGGSPVQSSLIYEEIRKYANEKNIPVYAFAEDVAASGGYWLACAGDEIYANAASIVGSIGVVAAGFGFTDFIKKHGIERRIYTQGENKSMLDPFQPEKQEDIDRLLAVQRDVHIAFKELVKERRGKRLNADGDELFSGAFWSGQQAKDLGLVDNTGNMSDILKQKFGKRVKLVYFNKSKSFIGGLLSGKLEVASIGQDLVIIAEERLHWQRFGL